MSNEEPAIEAATNAAVGEEPSPRSEVPQRFGVQFTATQEYVDLIEEVKALLSQAAPNVSLDEIHLRALRTFVAELKRKKHADVERPRDNPRQRGRHIPAAVRRVVYQRDLALRCRSHNALAAEHDFGRVFVESKRDSRPHERFVTQATGYARPDPNASISG